MHGSDWRPNKLRTALVALCVLLGFADLANAVQVGNVVFARGASGIERGDEILLMGNGTEIHEGDLLTIGQRSFAVIEFTDGTKMTLRPNTKFKVETFTQKEEEPSALFNLFKGGMRAVTGLIATSSDDAFTVDTPVAAIAIRGTDFSARLCDEECLAKAEQMQAAKPDATSLVHQLKQLCPFQFAGAALDSPFDIVFGHVVGFGLVNGQGQSGVKRRVPPTVASRNG